MKIIIFLLFFLSCEVQLFAQSEKMSFDFSGVQDQLKNINSFVVSRKAKQKDIVALQVKFSNLITEYSSKAYRRKDFEKIQSEILKAEQEVLQYQGGVRSIQEQVDALITSLEVSLESINSLKKNVNYAKQWEIVKKKKEIKKFLATLAKIKLELDSDMKVADVFLTASNKWKHFLAQRVKELLKKSPMRLELTVLLTEPHKVLSIFQNDFKRIMESNRREKWELFFQQNRIKIFMRLFLSLLVFIFFIKFSNIIEEKVLSAITSQGEGYLMSDILVLLFSHKIAFSFSAFYLLLSKNLGALSYSQMPSILSYIFISFLGIFFWHYFYKVIVVARVEEVNRERNSSFVFREMPVILFILTQGLISSFGIENIILDSINNFLLLFISIKFIWLSFHFKVKPIPEEGHHFYIIFATSSKFLVLFFSTVLCLSSLLNFFGSFSLGTAIQNVVFGNILYFGFAWLIYQIVLINWDRFISYVDHGGLQFRKRLVDMLVFVRNYSNILLLGWFTYFLLSSWFENLFLFSDFSKIVLFSIGDYKMTIDRPFYVLVSIFVVRLIYLLLLFVIDSYLMHYFKISRRHSANIYSITRYVFFLIYFLVISAVLGITYKNLLIFASALGVGIGFGLQNIVNNFLSGIILLFEQPIRVGDLIDIEGEFCKVRHLGIRSTVVQTMDNSSVIIPNSELLSNKVTNWTLNDNEIAIKCGVGVAYGTDTLLVKDILEKVAQQESRVLQFPEPQVWFDEFADSSLNFTLKVWIDRPMDKYIIKSSLMHEINKKLAEHQITIPFPQRDIHLINET